MKDDSKDIGHILKLLQRQKEKSDQTIAVTTGFGAGGIVLLYFVKYILPNAPIYFIDTGYHFQETLEIRDRIKKEWKLNIITISNDNTKVEPQANMKCCYERKVIPLEEILKECDIWVCAIRKGETKSRRNLMIVDESDPRVDYKVCPLANWTLQNCWNFIRAFELPYNKLYDKGIMSIGCEPCTKKSVNDNPRSGRFDGERDECGIHDYIKVRE